MSRKDTYRNYAIWVVLILFYASFHFLSNHGWVKKMEISPTSSEDSNPNKTAPISSSSVSETEKSPVKILTGERLPQIKPPSPINNRNIQTKKTISINHADKVTWESLYNIGAYRAGQILRFREALGGFYSIDQIGETYGLPDSVFLRIKPQLTVDSSFNRIVINQQTYDSLYLHPYITKFMAYQIVRYRETEKPVRSIDQLYDLLPEKDHERLKKLEPYLDYSIE